MTNTSVFGTGRRFDVTCRPKDLPDVIHFAMRFFDHIDMFTRPNNRVRPAYQISTNGKYYAITAGTMAPGGQYPNGLPTDAPWVDLPFDYDPKAIAKSVTEWATDKLGITRDDENPWVVIRTRSTYSILQDDPNNHGLSGKDDPILVFSAQAAGDFFE